MKQIKIDFFGEWESDFKKSIGTQPLLQIYPLIIAFKFDSETTLTLSWRSFSLLHLSRCILRRIQDPAKYLRWSFSQKYLTAKKMLNNLAKGSIVDVWRGPECTSECNSIKSYKKVAAEAILKSGNFYSVKYRRY